VRVSSVSCVLVANTQRAVIWQWHGRARHSVRDAARFKIPHFASPDDAARTE